MLAGRVLRLDWDRPRLPGDLCRRIARTLHTVRLRADLVLCRRTEHGWHVKVRLTRRCAPLVIVALQAVLGSDPRRETFNLKRARGLRRVPAELRATCYSVLFLRRWRYAPMPRKVAPPEGGYKRLPSIRPDDLGGQDVTVATIKEVQDNIPVTKPDGRKKFSMRMRFEEFPERNFWPNATSQGFLKKRLGPDVRTWNGRKVVLEVVEAETPEGEPTQTVWVAEPPTWGEHMKAFAIAAGQTGTTG